MRTHDSLAAGERGIALVSSILVLTMCAVVVAICLSAAIGERTKSTGTHVARASLFAADAGVRTAQQVMTNTVRARLDSVTAAWSGSGPIITNPNTFFAGMPAAVSCSDPGFDASISVAFQDSAIAMASQTFDYRYVITSNGAASGFGRRSVKSTGVMRVSASRGSFTDYLVYTNQHVTPTGASIWFTSSTRFDGRVHSNGRLRFAYQPQFADLVTSVSSDAAFYNNGDNRNLNDDHNADIDVPVFGGGFNRSAPNIQLPTNAFSQMNASLGLSASNTTQPTNETINTQLGLASSSSAPPAGVYVVQSGGTVTGGLYVQGDLSQCKLSIDGQGRQVYSMVQGAATKTITVDRVANQTLVQTTSGTTSYAGVPRGVMYVKGTISDLRGPDRVNGSVVPGVAEHTKLLIACEQDIVLQRDLTCAQYDTGDNVLGLFSTGGSVRVATTAPNDMSLDAFVMAAGTDGSFKVDQHNEGSPRGDFFLRGGMVTEFYGAFGTFQNDERRSGYGRRFSYDRRGIVPPYFPTTNRFEANDPAARAVTWVEF